MPTLDYKEHWLAGLADPDYAAGYLTAALEEGEDVFLLAIRDVADRRARRQRRSVVAVVGVRYRGDVNGLWLEERALR